jgi:exodeoxyribonuclease V alpha subunit
VDTLSGFDAEVTVQRARYVSPDSGWAVLDACDDDGEEIVLVGPLGHLETRERARVVGTWVDDPRYGPQVKVTLAAPLAPHDPEAVTTYLTRVKHVGAKRAARLIDRHGVAGVLEAIDRAPGDAFAATGLGRDRLQEAVASWERLRVVRQLHLLLAPHGLAYLVPRLHEAYGPTAHRVVAERPYELTSVFGVGFLIADRIARSLDSGVDEAERARAGALHLLAEAERGGSTCLPDDGLMRDLEGLLSAAPPEGLLARMVQDGDAVCEGSWVYRRQTAELEAELAELVAGLSQSPAAKRDAERDAPGGDELTAEQRQGVVNALRYRLSLITGGPGTGKTASIKAISAAAAAQGARVMLVAPTGRAAVRMSQASGLRAQTVHAALGWIPGEGPLHDQQDPVSCDLLIVDETSMANLELLVALLRAVPERASVVLVGDADQLAPVGAGKPFADLIAGGTVPTVRLNHIFRQAAGSMIVQGAHAIRRGETPSFAAGEGMRRDLFMVTRADPQAALQEIVSLVCRRLPEHYQVDPLTDIQVFAPVYRGELGIDALNLALRQVLNPDGEPVRGERLRLGDKVMLTGRNLHELGLMNGTLLRLQDEVSGGDGQDDPALILASEEAVFRVPAREADRLRLAYACSVHRGQGIELPVAVIVAHPAAGAFFLRREMLYTAVTRARLATVIVGLPQVVARAARTPDTGGRHGRLAERLAHGLTSEPPASA